MNLTLEDAQIVARAVERLEQPGAHIQGSEGSTGRTGRLYDSQICAPTAPEAHSWCAIGALKREGASNELIGCVGHFVEYGQLLTLTYHGNFSAIAILNDSRGGRPKIRAKMRDFVHAIVKLENKK